MAKYARGKKSLAISDVGGLRVPYTQLKTTWDGLRVSPEDFDPKQPQLTPAKNVVDATALFNPRPDTDPENVVVFIGYTQDWTIDPRLRPGVGVSAPGFIGFTGFEVERTSQTGVGGSGGVGTAEATIQTEIIAVGQSGDGEVGAIVREIVVTGVSGTAGAASVGVEALDISIDEAGVGGTGGVGTEAFLLEATPSGVGGSSNVGNEEPVGEINEVGVSGDGEVGTAIVEDPFGWGIGPWGLGPWGDTEGRPHPVGQSATGGIGSVSILADNAAYPSGTGGSGNTGDENVEIDYTGFGYNAFGEGTWGQ
tara:strand:- start:587 stop:1513 length:927 start_codon:yes stop_codon:yes gene_type:complete